VQVEILSGRGCKDAGIKELEGNSNESRSGENF
jgi:hypothetical protein